MLLLKISISKKKTMLIFANLDGDECEKYIKMYLET